jgi:UDP-MurNAc hydroxylase
LFDKSTPILFPEAITQRLVRDMKKMKYRNVTEIPHGGKFELAPGFDLYSYQFGPFFIDSGVVITDGKTVLFNANDAKFFGYPLKQIQDKFKHFDFVFRSHSSAGPLPLCIEDYESKMDELRPAQEYVEEFSHFAASLKARYAVPFASNHYFLHKEVLQYNKYAANPKMIADFYNGECNKQLGFESEAILMPAGSSWDDEKGFELVDFDYDKGSEYIESMLQKYEGKLQRFYEFEDSQKAEFRWCEQYFKKFFKVVPWYVTALVPRRVLFIVLAQGQKHFWLLDLKNRCVQECESEVNCDFSIEQHVYVMMDCLKKRLFSTWGASKRLKIRVYSTSKSQTVGNFLGLLDMYENDYFPLLSWRMIRTSLPRWREAAEFLRYVLLYKVLRRKFSIKDLYPVELNSNSNVQVDPV